MATSVVFDLGGVLADWNPRYLYEQLIDDPAELDRFLTEVVPLSWNHELDLGRPFGATVAERAEQFPEHRELVLDYDRRWLEMWGEVIDPTVEIAAELRARGVPLYLLSNAPEVLATRKAHELPFWDLFDGRILSAEEKVAKPDPRIWSILCDRFALEPASTVFVDDKPENVESARAFGIDAVRYEGPIELRAALRSRSLLA